ncbi:hypothetical protein AKJ16_DCAP08258 [Drosera capensis]
MEVLLEVDMIIQVLEVGMWMLETSILSNSLTGKIVMMKAEARTQLYWNLPRIWELLLWKRSIQKNDESNPSQPRSKTLIGGDKDKSPDGKTERWWLNLPYVILRNIVKFIIVKSLYVRQLTVKHLLTNGVPP